MSSQGQILLIDSITGEVKGRLQTGQSPDIALSPDGSRLFVTSTHPTERGVLDVIDTATGTVLDHVAVPYRTAYKLLPVWPRLSSSPDGRWLYISQLEWHPGTQPGTGWDELTVVAYDVQKGELVPGKAATPGCDSSRLIPLGSEGQVAVFCHRAQSAYLLDVIEGSGGTNITASAAVTVAGSSGAVSLPGAQAFLTVGGDGTITRLEGQSRQTERVTLLSLPSGKQVLVGAMALAPDGTRLYLGVSTEAERAGMAAQQVLVVDTSTWRVVQTLTTSQPFAGFALSRDGRTLHTFEPNSGAILSIDTSTYQQRAGVEKVGTEPSFIVTVP